MAQPIASPRTPPLRWMLLLVFLSSLFGIASSAHHQHEFQYQLHQEWHDVKTSASPTVTSSYSSLTTLEEAKEIIQNAQVSLASVKKGRLTYPQLNQYKDQSESRNEVSQPASALGSDRNFPGFQIYKIESLEGMGLTESCTTALTQKILCSPVLNAWKSASMGR